MDIDPKSTPPGVEPKKARSEKDILERMRERLKMAVDEYSNERKKQKDDLLFSTLDQWPSEIRAQRENDPHGSRPCLTIDQINQYIVQVVNDMRQNRPAVKVRPVDDKGDVQTAEVMQGIIRQIEDQSTAQIAYATAAESSVRVGEGYFRVITEYENEMSFEQVIRIKRVPDMFTVYLGPHQMPDGSDAEYGFIFEDIPLEVFRRKWPDAKYQSTDFSEIEDRSSDWIQEHTIRVAEYFNTEYEKATVCLYEDGTTKVKSPGEKKAEGVIDERETRIPKINWYKVTGIEILDERDWPGKFIPIVKEIGKEAWVDGKRCNWGLVRPAKDSLRMYNYWASAITEKIGLAPKSPFIMAEGQMEGHEDEWGKANLENRAALTYKAQTVDGTIVPPPQRQMPAPVEVAMVQQLQIIREDVQASLGMFKAALGREQPNQSGKAILALTRESDTGTFHFSDNQRISIEYCGRILVDLIPKIYDTARVVKILGEDGKLRTAELNPEQEQAVSQMPEGNGIRNIYNLGVGTYDVTVTVGPSFNTKRMEAATMFTDLANTSKDPVSGTIMRYLAIKNSDFNGAEQAAEMMEKLLPPGLIKQEGQPNIPPEVQQQMMQMKQIIQAQGQEMQKLQSGEKAKELKVQADHDAKMKSVELERQEAQAEITLAREKAEAELALERWVAEQKAQLARDIAVAENGVEQQKVEIQRAKEADEIRIKQQQQVEKEALPLAENIMPKVTETMNQVVTMVQDSMKQHEAMMGQMLEMATGEREAIIKKDKDGNIIGASSKMVRH